MTVNQEKSDAYSVAWFKLAECISRREKERALGVFRLLSHSFDSQAVAFQLEGDILRSFNDMQGAIDVYEKAAECYIMQHELTKAIAVYDHLCTITQSGAYVEKIIALYVQLKEHNQAFIYACHLCLILLRNHEYNAVQSLADRFGLQAQHRIDFFMQTVYKALADNFVPHGVKVKVVHGALDLIMHDVRMLTVFYSKIKAIDQHYYEQACDYVQSKV